MTSRSDGLPLNRLEELVKQLHDGSLDSDATADIIEALEELKELLQHSLAIDEYEKGMWELPAAS